jgi:predicted O-methyltransferase YrrM
MQMLEFNWGKILDQAARIRESDFMAEMLQRREAQGSKSPMGARDCAFIYALTRWRRPQVVVETGGFLGMSSSFILKALFDEGIANGKIYSVEMLPDCAHGVLIPEELKSGFVSLRGRVEDFMKRDEFPAKIDMFLHDSSHRYKHMLMEFKYFWKKLGDGDLLLSHDVNMSAAFSDFVSKTYKHDKIGQTDPMRTTHYEWGRLGKVGFIIKKAQI